MSSYFSRRLPVGPLFYIGLNHLIKVVDKPAGKGSFYFWGSFDKTWPISISLRASEDVRFFRISSDFLVFVFWDSLHISSPKNFVRGHGLLFVCPKPLLAPFIKKHIVRVYTKQLLSNWGSLFSSFFYFFWAFSFLQN